MSGQAAVLVGVFWFCLTAHDASAFWLGMVVLAVVWLFTGGREHESDDA